MQAHSRPRTVTASAVRAVPRQGAVDADLRDLLEANLRALHAMLDEQHRALDGALRAIAALRDDLRALGSPNAPWVQALQETRALLYVALREVIVGNDTTSTQSMSRPASSAERPTRT